MRRKDDGGGDVYLLSLDTFMIMSVVGLSLGMIFFLLNPSFKDGEAGIKIEMITYEIDENEFFILEKNISEKNKKNKRTWVFSNNKNFLKIGFAKPKDQKVKLRCRLFSDKDLDNVIKDKFLIINTIKKNNELKLLHNKKYVEVK